MDWRLWFHLETNIGRSDALQTSEAAKTWTETSPDSKLSDINNRLNSVDWNRVDNLKDLIQRREYKKFQKEIWLTWSENLNWKLWAKSLEMLDIYLSKLDQVEASQQSTGQELGSLWTSIVAPRQTVYADNGKVDQIDTNAPNNRIDFIKINYASKRYLSKYESLDQNTYELLFSWKEELWQWQLPNCYLISWLIELANTQYFDTLMRTSIKRVQFKEDNAMWYNIRIPLWEPDGRDILIKDSELELSEVRWHDGYKLLELAYVKNKRDNNAEWNKYSPVTYDEIVAATNTWTMTRVLQVFLWKHNIGFSDFWSNFTDNEGLLLSSLPQERKTEITNYLKHFDGTIWNKFTNLGTPVRENKDWDSASFEVWWKTMYYWHTYALSSVDDDLNIYVKNPRNNNEPWGSEVKLSLNEFFNSFSLIRVGRIKVDTFLDDEWIPQRA